MRQQERPYVHITQGCLDARDIEFSGIPSAVEICPSCKGNGKRVQHYIEGLMTGRCDFCDANGFIYSGTAKAAPFSVTNQIAVASKVECKRFDIYGLDWRKS